MAINVKLLRKVQKHILEEPNRFVMGDFIQRKTKKSPQFYGDDFSHHDFAPCGTAACIAGWAFALVNPKSRATDGNLIERKAVQILGLEYDPTGETETNSGKLFFVTQWPKKYRNSFRAAKSQKMRARVAVRRIDHFIKTKGAE